MIEQALADAEAPTDVAPLVDGPATLASEPDQLTERVLDAALVLVARWGVAKTALADVAKAAGCSRATVYRVFPGGKAQLFGALAARELDAYLQGVLDAIDTAEDLEDGVTRAVVVAARMLADHDAAQFVLEHEPGLLLPFLGFKQVEVLYRYTGEAIGPHLERFVPAERARWLTELASRLFISYLFNPAADVDLATEAHTRALVGRYVMPSFQPSFAP